MSNVSWDWHTDIPAACFSLCDAITSYKYTGKKSTGIQLSHNNRMIELIYAYEHRDTQAGDLLDPHVREGMRDALAEAYDGIPEHAALKQIQNVLVTLVTNFERVSGIVGNSPGYLDRARKFFSVLPQKLRAHIG